MKYSCVLKIPNDKKLFMSLEPEMTKSKRASWKLNKTKAEVQFFAEDISAMRALFNSLTKLLSVWETVENGTTTRRSR